MDQPIVNVRKLDRPQDAKTAYCCMTEVVTPWPQALFLCREWLQEHLGKNIEGFHLELEDGEVVGHLYYALSQNALVPYEIEQDVGVIYCEWVQRRHQGKGYSRRLFSALLNELKQQNAKGVMVEATTLQGQMHMSHFLARGFRVILEQGDQRVMYLPLRQEQVLITQMMENVPAMEDDKVQILIIHGYLCPFDTSTHELMREVVQEFADKVHLLEVYLTPETLHQYGVAKGIFINGKRKLGGGETELAVRQAILEALEGWD
jgi:N-acetylglutamate synthase-like GNAT family acetyltransferase